MSGLVVWMCHKCHWSSITTCRTIANCTSIGRKKYFCEILAVHPSVEKKFCFFGRSKIFGRKKIFFLLKIFCHFFFSFFFCIGSSPPKKTPPPKKKKSCHLLFF